jgi:hypothetical protein
VVKELFLFVCLCLFCLVVSASICIGSGGDEVFAKWFCALLEESSRYQVKFEHLKRKKEREMGFEVYESSDEEESEDATQKKKKKGRRTCSFVSVSSVFVLHKLLMLEELYGMSKTSFVSLCLEAAEEKKYPAKQVCRFFDVFSCLYANTTQDMVPVPIIKTFAFEFVRGLTRLMHRLGFSRGADDDAE